MSKQYILAANALRLNSQGKDSIHHVLDTLHHAGIDELCYAIKSRVKSDEKLIEKVERKQKNDPDYRITSITDVLGLRLVVLFRREIPRVLHEVLALLCQKSKVQPNPFQPGCLTEALVYTVNPRDPFLVDLKDVFSAVGVSYSVKPTDSYSSVHLVCKFPPHVQLDGDDGKKIQHPIYVETQIRTVFEDAWGEVDHRYGYSPRSGKLGIEPVANAAAIAPHLEVLKQFADSCSRYADVIHEMATVDPSKVDISGKVLTVQSDESFIVRFQELQVPGDLIQGYSDGRTLREKAEVAKRENASVAAALYLEAAEHFLGLQKNAAEALEDSVAKNVFVYYIRLNEALCLMSTDTPHYVLQAASLYSTIVNDYPDYPLAKFRLGQALSKLGEIDRAIDLFQASYREVEQVVQQQKLSGVWPVSLAEADYQHMRSALPRLLSFDLWKKSQVVESSASKIRLLRAAFLVMMKSLPLPDPASTEDLVRAHNNIVYYGVACLELLKDRTPEYAKNIKAQLEISLPILEAEVSNAPRSKVYILDTLLAAYKLLARQQEAQTIAQRIINVLTSGDSSQLSEREAASMQKAIAQLPLRG